MEACNQRNYIEKFHQNYFLRLEKEVPIFLLVIKGLRYF